MKKKFANEQSEPQKCNAGGHKWEYKESCLNKDRQKFLKIYLEMEWVDLWQLL